MSKQPEFKILTAFCSNKMRFRTVPERSLRPLVESALKELETNPRFVSRGDCLGTYALPSGSVLEIYEQDGAKTGYMFLSLDTWLSYPNRLVID